MQDFSNTAKYPKLVYSNCIDNDSCYIQVRCNGKCPLNCPNYQIDQSKTQ